MTTRVDKYKLVLLRRKQAGINDKLRSASQSRLERGVNAKKRPKGTA